MLSRNIHSFNIFFSSVKKTIFNFVFSTRRKYHHVDVVVFTHKDAALDVWFELCLSYDLCKIALLFVSLCVPIKSACGALVWVRTVQQMAIRHRHATYTQWRTCCTPWHCLITEPVCNLVYLSQWSRHAGLVAPQWMPNPVCMCLDHILITAVRSIAQRGSRWSKAAGRVRWKKNSYELLAKKERSDKGNEEKKCIEPNFCLNAEDKWRLINRCLRCLLMLLLLLNTRPPPPTHTNTHITQPGAFHFATLWATCGRTFFSSFFFPRMLKHHSKVFLARPIVFPGLYLEKKLWRHRTF